MARVRGITIKLDAQYAGVLAAFRNVTSKCNDVNKALRDVNKMLKFDPKNIELMRQQQEYWGKDIDTTKNKIKELQNTLKVLKAQPNSWKNTEQINAINREIEALKLQEKELKNGRNQLNAYKQTIEGLSKSIDLAKNKITAINAAFKNATTYSDLVKQKQAALRDEYRDTTDKVNTLKEALDMLKGKDLSPEMKADQDRLQAELVETETDLRNIQQEMINCETTGSIMGTQLATKFKSMGDKMGAASRALMPFTAGVVALGTASIRMAMDVESSFQKVMSIVQANGDAELLSYANAYEGVLEASTKTGVAIADFNEALYQSISASVPAGEAIDFTTEAVKLARGGFTTTTQAVDLMTTVLNAYGDKADTVTNIMDDLLTTQNRGKTTVDLLSTSMGRIIPTAAAAGVEFEQVATAMAVLTKNGISTRYSATYLTSMFNELTQESGKAAKNLKELSGKSFTELINEGNSLADIIGILQKGADDAGVTLNNMFGNMRGGQAAMALMTNEGKEFSNILVDMKGNAGAAQQAFETMDNTPAVKMQKALNEMKNVAIDIGYQLMPVVTKVLKVISEWIKKYQSLSKSQKDVINKIVLFTAALSPVLGVLSKVTKGIGGMIQGVADLGKKLSNFKTFGSELSSVTGAFSGLGGVIAGVAIAAAGVVRVIRDLNGFHSEIETRSAKVNETIKNAQDSAKALQDCINDVDNSYAEIGAEEEKASYAKTIIDKLDAMRDATGKVTGSQKKAASLIRELNQLYPDMAAEIDKTTGAINLSTDAMNDYVDSQLNQKKAAWYSDRITEALEDQFDAKYELDQLNIQMTDNEKKLEDAEKKMQSTFGNGSEYDIAQGNLDALRSEHEKLQTAITEQEGVIKESEITIQGYSDTYEKLRGDMEGTADILKVKLPATWAEIAQATIEFEQTTAEKYNNLSDDQKLLAQNFIEAWGEIETSLQNSIANAMNMFDEFNGGVEMSMDEMIANLQSQIDGVTTWEQNMNTLFAAGINEDLLNTLRDAGPQSANLVQELVNSMNVPLEGGGTKLDEISAMWGEKVKVMGVSNGEGEALKENLASALGSSMEGLPEMFKENGADTWLGFVDGLSEGIESATAEMDKDVQEIDNTATDGLEIHSPSRLFMRHGKDVVQGLANGLRQNSGIARSAMQTIVRAIDISSQAGVLFSQAAYVGRMIGQGLSNGMNGMLGQVQGIASRLGSAATDAIQKAAAVRSPSRKTMWIGEMIDEGLIVGMRRKMGEVASTASNLVAIPSGMAAAGTSMINNTTSNVVNNNSFSFNVSGADGNAYTMANAVMRIIQNKVNTKGAVWA